MSKFSLAPRRPCFSYTLFVHDVASNPRHTVRWGISVIWIWNILLRSPLISCQMVHMFFRMFAALASGTVDQSVLKKPNNPLLDLKPRTPPPPEPEEETRWGQIIDHNTNKTIERPSIRMVLRWGFQILMKVGISTFTWFQVVPFCSLISDLE